MTTYTPEQIAVARDYEQRAFDALHDDEKYRKVMGEFDEIKAGWDAERAKAGA